MHCCECNSVEGCNDHKMWKCPGCNRILPWSKGCADDMPDHCDDCWGEVNTDKHADAIAMHMRNA